MILLWRFMTVLTGAYYEWGEGHWPVWLELATIITAIKERSRHPLSLSRHYETYRAIYYYRLLPSVVWITKHVIKR